MKVLCILTDGFEELEAIGTVALLRRANITVDVYAIDATTATGRFDLSISNIHNLMDVNKESYDMLFLPGGPHYVKLEENKAVVDMIHYFFNEHKFVGAICAAPTILGRLGYLKDRQYTCFTSMNENFLGTYIDTYAVRDGNLITGRSAAATIEFAFLIIEALEGKNKADEVKASIYF